MVWTAAWLALALYVCWIVRQVCKNTLMRCPETGAVTLVGIETASRSAVRAPGVKVQRCGLWPNKKNCASGCLARYEETEPGYRVNLDALRPFERQ